MIELLREIVERNDLIGDDDFELAAGETLQVRTGVPQSITTLLQEQVPAGKKWSVHIAVTISETDV